MADLKVYSTDIFLPLSPSLQEIDLLFANSPKETLILSSFSPDDKKGNCSIDFNKTWNPLKKIFQDCNIQIHSYLNNCTVRFWVNQFYSPSIFLTINNIYNLFVNKSSSRINGVEVDLNGTHLIEISVSTQILVYYDGNKIISNRNPSFGLYELNITNMDIWGLAIIQGVYSSQKHLVFKGVEETVYSNSFELDHIQYHNTALYPKYVNLLRQKEREEEIQPLIPKTINNIISNPTIYQTEKISNISVEGKTLSVSFIDYTNPYDRDQFIGLTNNFFSEIIKLKSVDTRQNIPFYSIVNNPLFVEGFYNGTIKGFATHPNLINTTKYKGFVKLDQNNNIDYLDSFEIRSFILVYKETELTPNRGYIGGQQNYVNGGSNGQIIGNIVIGLQDFSFVKSINTRSKDVSVSGKTIVVVDNANRVILVYRNLTLIQTIDPEQETLWDMGAVVKCVNEDRFLLGLKDGLFSNEGSVQIWDWNSTLSKFERRLYLNSPDSNQSGFGFSVDLRGNLLFVGQLGNQTTYVFQETNNIFSTTPIAVISGADTKVTETYIYCRNTLTNTITVYDNSYTELVRINNVNRFSANQEILVTVDLMNNTVTRYEDLVETETIIGINEFGFDVDINTHKQILVGSPEEGKIYLYSPSSLSNPVVISGSSFFGYSVSISEDYLLVSNFNNVVNIYSRDGTLIGDNVLSVFENGNPIEKIIY
ncbi:MAG: hypothetical protein CV045_08430 [Cyanobacteria bacterium M5B4]|nr:MAG: hypothetical protein CV045_08430 [Cyanobacteria bacterium M5B4]